MNTILLAAGTPFLSVRTGNICCFRIGLRTV